MVTYEWVDGVGKSHFKSVAFSLFLVFMMASLVFRSLVAGVFALAPVGVSILLVYAVLAVFRIDIGIGTSMFASVAIGLGVDFSIHTIDRMKQLLRSGKGTGEELIKLFPSTGRALFFNLLALSLGFGVLVSSEVVPLVRFGAIVAVAVSAAFLFALTILPAMVVLIKPNFLFEREEKRLPSPVMPLILLVVLTGGIFSHFAEADESLSGRQIMESVVARYDGEQVTRNLRMELTDRRGKTRVRETVGFRKYFGDDKRTVLFYTNPSNIKDTGFLTWDYRDHSVDDDQWLYLPATRKIRRISASDRGDYFLGTDFTYEDIKNENKPDVDDYVQTRLGTQRVDGVECIIVEGVPISEEIKRELGYSRVVSYVDPDIWMIRRSEFWDIKDNPLKETSVKDIRRVDDVWTAHEISIIHLKTGHSTRFSFSNVTYKSEVDDSFFETRQLRRGLK